MNRFCAWINRLLCSTGLHPEPSDEELHDFLHGKDIICRACGKKVL